MKDTLSHLIVVTDSNNRKHPIDIRVVIKIKNVNGHTQIHYFNNRVLRLEQPLGFFNELIVRHGFIRINKDCILNLQYLEGIKPGKKVLAVLTDGSEESVAREIRKTLAHYVLETVYS